MIVFKNGPIRVRLHCVLKTTVTRLSPLQSSAKQVRYQQRAEVARWYKSTVTSVEW